MPSRCNVPCNDDDVVASKCGTFMPRSVCLRAVFAPHFIRTYSLVRLCCAPVWRRRRRNSSTILLYLRLYAVETNSASARTIRESLTSPCHMTIRAMCYLVSIFRERARSGFWESFTVCNYNFVCMTKLGHEGKFSIFYNAKRSHNRFERCVAASA